MTALNLRLHKHTRAGERFAGHYNALEQGGPGQRGTGGSGHQPGRSCRVNNG
jgi:hypothetical protein